MKPLSPRQAQVADKIAFALGLAEPTVRMHTRAVLEKLCAQNRTQVAARLAA